MTRWMRGGGATGRGAQGGWVVDWLGGEVGVVMWGWQSGCVGLVGGGGDYCQVYYFSKFFCIPKTKFCCCACALLFMVIIITTISQYASVLNTVLNTFSLAQLIDVNSAAGVTSSTAGQ